MRGIDQMIIKDIPMPKAGKKEVLVKLEYVGICGSDVHYFHHGNCGAYKAVSYTHLTLPTNSRV